MLPNMRPRSQLYPRGAQGFLLYVHIGNCMPSSGSGTSFRLWPAIPCNSRILSCLVDIGASGLIPAHALTSCVLGGNRLYGLHVQGRLVGNTVFVSFRVYWYPAFFGNPEAWWPETCLQRTIDFLCWLCDPPLTNDAISYRKSNAAEGLRYSKSNERNETCSSIGRHHSSFTVFSASRENAPPILRKVANTL